MSDVIPMSEFAAQRDQIGPKLHRLADLAAWGYRVPDGFALSRSAVQCLLDRDPATPLPGPLSAAIAAEVDALCARLGDPAPVLAVRSAALAEDGDQRSFAGMFHSVLGVRGQAQLEAAIAACVASGRSERVKHYGDGGAITVGVQELIGARASGVVFSRHPVTHRSDRLVVEAVLGLGPSMVDGVAQPDHIEVGRADLRILRYDIGAKERRAAVAADGGIELEDSCEELRHAPCVSTRELEALCQAAIDIEARLERAVDLEWVVDGDGDIALVQVRPITGGPARAREPVRWDPLAYARRIGRRRDR